MLVRSGTPTEQKYAKMIAPVRIHDIVLLLGATNPCAAVKLKHVGKRVIAAVRCKACGLNLADMLLRC